MAVKFDHPNVGAPTTTVTLGNVENFPFSRPQRVLQSAYQTDGGGSVIYDWGDTRRAFTVTLFPLTAAQKTLLEGFFDTTVNGRVTKFDYTDGKGDVFTVRFNMDVLDIVERSFERYQVQVTLLEVP